MNIRPLGDRIVVKALDAEVTTKGGIILPDTAKEKPQKGKVLSVGTGRILDNGTRVPLDVREGEQRGHRAREGGVADDDDPLDPRAQRGAEQVAADGESEQNPRADEQQQTKHRSDRHARHEDDRPERFAEPDDHERQAEVVGHEFAELARVEP